MTVVYTADVFCDRCANWISGGVAKPKPSGLAKQAIAHAKLHGWSRDVRSIYLDLCPACLSAARADPK